MGKTKFQYCSLLERGAETQTGETQQKRSAGGPKTVITWAHVATLIGGCENAQRRFLS